MAATLGGVTVNNPLAISNPYAGGANPASSEPGSGSGGVIGNASLAPAPLSVPSNIKTLSPLPLATDASSGASTGSTQTAAQIAAQNNYNNLFSGYQAGIGSSIGTAAGDYNTGILDAVNANKNSQLGINAQAVQNELAKDQGFQSVTDMVNNGISGGGVLLDDDNAGTSSAAGALARAYGAQGREAASQVGNEAAQGENTIDNSQIALNNDEATQLGDIGQKKQDTINGIVSSAQQSLSYLAAIGASTGNVADQVDIAQQIAQVKAQATAALSAYDSQLGGITTSASAPSDNAAKAQSLLTAGTAPASEFNYTTVAPPQVAGSGPSASNLPIFISPSNKNTIPSPV